MFDSNSTRQIILSPDDEDSQIIGPCCGEIWTSNMTLCLEAFLNYLSDVRLNRIKLHIINFYSIVYHFLLKHHNCLLLSVHKLLHHSAYPQCLYTFLQDYHVRRKLVFSYSFEYFIEKYNDGLKLHFE